MSISDWPQGERPRERLLQHGPQALSDAELLAIWLRVGIRGKSAVDLARELLSRHDDSLSRLAASSAAELAKIPGIGLAKAAQLQASFELTRRALAEEIRERRIMNAPGAVRDWLRLHLGHRPHEVFIALWLDSQHRLLDSEDLFRGSLAQTSVYPREVVKSALRYNAAAVIFAHNHPSGVCEPSRADYLLTRQLKEALALVDVRLLDHFIVTGDQPPLSLAERGGI
jgi:DNA repair protein RadC